jgi:hypothetical protein
VRPPAQLFQGAERLAPGRIGSGLQCDAARGRAGDADGRVPRNPSSVTRWPDDSPLIVFKSDFNYGNTVRSLALAYLLRAPGLHAVGMEQPVVGVFMIDGEQRAIRAQGKELDRVVVHSRLQRLLLGAVAGIEAKRRLCRRGPDRIAPRKKQLRPVTRWHGHLVRAGDRYRGEAEKRRASSRARRACRQSCHEAGEAGSQDVSSIWIHGLFWSGRNPKKIAEPK